MSTHRVSLQLTDEALAEFEAAMATIERVFTGLVALSDRQRRHEAKMGDRSEAFCRQTLSTLAQNPEIVPPRLDVARALQQLRTFERMRAPLHRMAVLNERLQDTDMALRADLMAAAREGYALLKVTGRAMGLEGQRQEIATRFARRKGPRARPGDVPAATPDLAEES